MRLRESPVFQAMKEEGKGSRAPIRDSFANKLAGMGWSAWLLHARLTAMRLVEDLGPFGLLLAVAAACFGLARPLSLAARERDGDARHEVSRGTTGV